MYYAYILLLSNKQYYIGSSYDLKKRLAEHKRGGVSATKNKRPFELVFYSAFTSQKLAIDFEKYLKSSSGYAFRSKRLV
ncbi:MAG: GIY-YIG nuclease family protein [bacterium]|nr:GIY-YIG nuclease family protein [bacterium]